MDYRSFVCYLETIARYLSHIPLQRAFDVAKEMSVWKRFGEAFNEG